MPNSSPASRASAAASIARFQSAPSPRRMGMWPLARKNQATFQLSKYSALATYLTRRGTTRGRKNESQKEMWFEARMAGPWAGRGSRPPSSSARQRPGAGASDTSAPRHAQALGFTVLDTYHNAISGFAASMGPLARAALAADPMVASIEPDRPFHADGQVVPTGIERIHADVSKAASIDDVDQPRVNVNVAVLDTGIDTSHPDLNVAGGGTCAKGRNYDDHYGHGTHAAGIVGALDNSVGVVGVAPGANMFGVKVLDDEGNGTTRELLCGIDWVTTTRTDSDP